MSYDTARLRGKIKEEGYTEGQIAKIIGMSRQSFSNKVNKKTAFELSEAIKLSEILGVTLDYLFMNNCA